MQELQRSGQARTSKLADDFGVSEVTIRSDLEILDAKKQLQHKLTSFGINAKDIECDHNSIFCGWTAWKT